MNKNKKYLSTPQYNIETNTVCYYVKYLIKEGEADEKTVILIFLTTEITQYSEF